MLYLYYKLNVPSFNDSSVYYESERLKQKNRTASVLLFYVLKKHHTCSSFKDLLRWTYSYTSTDRNLQLHAKLLTDNQGPRTPTDDIQCSIFNLHLAQSEYNTDISTEKSVPTKICLNSKILEKK
jgi:hypothetical protein